MMWACVCETRVWVTTADVYGLEFSLPSILCYITCIRPPTCFHEDPSPFWDFHTSPLGLLLIWTFVLSIRRHWAGLAGDILGLRVTWAEAGDTEWPGAAVITSVIEQIVRETEPVRELSDCIVLNDVLVRERLEYISDYIAYVCIFVLYRRVVYVMYFIQYSQCMYIWCIFSHHRFL